MSSISERIKSGLEMRDMKQADLSKITGISRGALSSYISGRYVPKQGNIYRIAKALNVSEIWLMGADVPYERKESFFVSQAERELIEKFAILDDSGKEAVQFILNHEYERCKK